MDGAPGPRRSRSRRLGVDDVIRPLFDLALGGILALAAMQSHTGGVSSAYAVLVMTAMVWFGLRRSAR